jgi:hypothetical protein
MPGVRVIRAAERRVSTAQTTNMRREAAIEPAQGAAPLTNFNSPAALDG